MEGGPHPVPAKSNPLGTKGCGEAGCAGSLSTIVNAVIDALSEYGITHIDMPLTPERVWRAIQEAKAKAAEEPYCSPHPQSSSPALCAISHWGGGPSISQTPATEPRSRGVLDSPPSRGMTGKIGARGVTPYAAACSLGW